MLVDAARLGRLIMSSNWGTAFFVAAATALLTTPLFRRLARTVGLLDRPGAAKSHAVAVPYLGGTAIALGVLAGLLLSFAYGRRVGVVALVAAGLSALGLLDDDHLLLPRTRLGVEVCAALATFALGLRFEVTGVGLVDGLLTVIWIVGITNATNFLDNMDGLAAGVAASIAGSSLLLMIGRGGGAAAVLAASVLGACLGFLVYNKRPASVYMGDAGSLFLGYLLAVITLAATQSLPPGSRLAVPLMLAAVPLADITTVVISRLRRGLSPMQAGKDHLSHRLAHGGWPAGRAVPVLVMASLLVGLLGSLAGRGVLPMHTAMIAATAVLGLLLRAALPVPVYLTPVTGLHAGLRLAVAATVIAGGVLALRTRLLDFGGSRTAVPFHAGNGVTLERMALLVAAFSVIAITLVVVVVRRRQDHQSQGTSETPPHGGGVSRQRIVHVAIEE